MRDQSPLYLQARRAPSSVQQRLRNGFSNLFTGARVPIKLTHVPGVDEAEGEDHRAGPQEHAPAGEHAGQSVRVASASLFLLGGLVCVAAQAVEVAAPAAGEHGRAAARRARGVDGVGAAADA
jgi:hypothetical protein